MERQKEASILTAANCFTSTPGVRILMHFIMRSCSTCLSAGRPLLSVWLAAVAILIFRIQTEPRPGFDINLADPKGS
jgi:hypothetical protein